MSLTPAEREAVLIYDEESNEYHVYCSSSKENTRMRRAGWEPYKSDEDGSYYRVPRNQVSFRSKSERKPMSEERRKAAAEHLAKAREARQGGDQDELRN